MPSADHPEKSPGRNPDLERQLVRSNSRRHLARKRSAVRTAYWSTPGQRIAVLHSAGLGRYCSALQYLEGLLVGDLEQTTAILARSYGWMTRHQEVGPRPAGGMSKTSRTPKNDMLFE